MDNSTASDESVQALKTRVIEAGSLAATHAVLSLSGKGLNIQPEVCAELLKGAAMALAAVAMIDKE
jgi:hypothetical protein